MVNVVNPVDVVVGKVQTSFLIEAVHTTKDPKHVGGTLGGGKPVSY